MPCTPEGPIEARSTPHQPTDLVPVAAANHSLCAGYFFDFLPGKYVVDRFWPFAVILPSAISLRIGSARSLVVVPSSLLICSMRRPGLALTYDANLSDSISRSAAVRLAPRPPRGRPAREPPVSATSAARPPPLRPPPRLP